MKTTNVVQDAVELEDVSADAQEMTIDAGSSVFLMDALGKLYSSPARAVLREYLANAIDAHVEAGGKRPPVEISLPSRDNDNVLSIRDYGNGMSEEGFTQILSRYGASTKRNSNKLTGGFGLGAKAGFAVGNEFFMTSYQKGKMLKVRIYKVSGGKGYVEVIDRAATTEPDGMLVEVTIPAGNVQEISRASLIDANFFEAYTSEEIQVSGREITDRYYNTVERFTIDIDEFSLLNTEKFRALEHGGNIVGWVSTAPSRTPIRVIIGRVSYEIKWDSAENKYAAENSYSTKFNSALRELNKLERQVVLNIPIGSVELPSSREEITYSERSLRTIQAVSETVKRLISEHFKQEVHKKETGYEALLEILNLRNASFWDADSLTWQGKVPPLKGETWRGFPAMKSDMLYFSRNPNDRPALSVELVRALTRSTVRDWSLSDTTLHFTMKTSTQEEFALASKKVRTSIADYHHSLRDKGSDYRNISITVVPPNDEESFWFECGTQLTLEQMLEETKAYRSAKRKKVQQALVKSGNVTTITPSHTKAREAIWLDLSAKGGHWPLAANVDEEVELLTDATNFYYLSRAEVKDVSTLLYEFTPLRQNGVSRFHSGHAPLMSAIQKILGDDTKIVFLPANRNMAEFLETFPHIPSLVDALRAKLIQEWDEVESGLKKTDTFLQSLFWESDNTIVVSLINNFVSVLTDSEKASLNSDLLEILDYMPYKGRGSGNTISVLFSVLVGKRERRDVIDWMQLKLNKVKLRYPLLTMTNPFGSDWTLIKPHMLAYVKGC